jgi:hypothetical protein
MNKQTNFKTKFYLKFLIYDNSIRFSDVEIVATEYRKCIAKLYPMHLAVIGRLTGV